MPEVLPLILRLILLPVTFQAFYSALEEMEELDLFHLSGSHQPLPNMRSTTCALQKVKLNFYWLKIYLSAFIFG